MIRPLVIDRVLRSEAAKIVRYADKHHYIVGESGQVPGDNPRHVLKTDFGYRCVFSYTVLHGKKFRDLSVSVATKGKYPNQFALYAIATELFGFTGWDGKTIEPPPEDWMIAKDVVWDAVRVAQECKTHSPRKT